MLPDEDELGTETVMEESRVDVQQQKEEMGTIHGMEPLKEGPMGKGEPISLQVHSEEQVFMEIDRVQALLQRVL